MEVTLPSTVESIEKPWSGMEKNRFVGKALDGIGAPHCK